MMPRRAFLKSSLILAAPALSIPAFAKTAQAAPGERTLRLYNTHTGEKLSTVFWAEGEFIPDAMKDINKVLRDHRSNKVAEMDPELMLLLTAVNAKMGNNKELHIISGYRSPESNAKLHSASGGVAKRSLHMEAKAIDIRIPGKDLKMLQRAALSIGGGGVGYYPDSQFVHMDTGRVRSW
ncbi:DUF882 domain-containing protein [Telluria aromaticivorans]|uniref:Murein endopeptidase K n=1 Tax=Telluria aromaticivorans TaxID=2725995 RepID=A0A7Y2P0B5_9BURK|nr:DUF882 domain-containing protein [Telluria aromaticivorans]NNG24777.1 DUF882 domain-containing protein [Telluria aromaticivorans]